MSIVTKTGDSGTTSLLHGRRVKKTSLWIEIFGLLDEINSFLGLAKSLIRERAIKKIIEKIQKELFVIGREVGTAVSSLTSLKRRISSGDIRSLELSIERLEKKFKRKGFILPGKNTVSAHLDVTRSLVRRLERRMLTLKNKKMLKNNDIAIYLNRLSDLVYLLARAHDKKKS